MLLLQPWESAKDFGDLSHARESGWGNVSDCHGGLGGY